MSKFHSETAPAPRGDRRLDTLMKTLLLVEPDSATRDYLALGVSGMTDEMRVLTARQGEEAARVLASGEVDILVTELVMPVMDGFELLSYVLDEYPSIEIVVMGEPGWGRTQEALSADDAFRFLTKPLSAGDLADAVRGILSQPAKGRLRGLSLPGFLQLLHAEQRTCALVVKSRGKQGRLLLQAGEVVDASFQGVKGKEGLFEILSWPSPDIEVEEVAEPVSRSLDERLPSLLLEAALRLDDERPRDAAAVPEAPAAAPVTTAAAPPDGAAVSGSFSSFAAAPLPVDIAAAAQGLRAFMRLEGTLGAGIIDFETGRSLAHVCRGRSTYFANMAAKAATTVRDGMSALRDADLRQSVRHLKLYGPHQFQLVRVVPREPPLMLFFAGLMGQTDAVTAGQLLADFERMLAEPQTPAVVRRLPDAGGA
jgi:CheY-like chemotaxis protein